MAYIQILLYQDTLEIGRENWGGGETAGIRLRYNSLTNTANRADGRVSKTYLFYLSLRHVSAIFDHKINE